MDQSPPAKSARTPVEPKQVLITGAAGGIGVALANCFREHGHRVCGTDIAPQPSNLEVDKFVQLDLQEFVKHSLEGRRELLNEIHAWSGGEGLDVVVNNAAIQILAPTEELDLAAWNTSLNVNLLAPFFLVQTLIPELEQARGSVVNISSIHARLTKSNYVAYATTKAAMSGMTRALAVDLGNRVRVNAIEPASIDTPMLRASFLGKEDAFGNLAQCHPQERVGSTAEVASLAYSIALGDFQFLHGACIDLSGGISARLFDPS